MSAIFPGPLLIASCLGLSVGVAYQHFRMTMRDRADNAAPSVVSSVPQQTLAAQHAASVPTVANDTRYTVNPSEYNPQIMGEWFPVMVQEKYDGIRMTVRDGVAYSRSGKPIPNMTVQAWAQRHALTLDNCDGELMAGAGLQDTQSFAMSRHAKDAFTFMIFNTVIDGFDCAPFQIARTPRDVDRIFDTVKERGGEGIVIKTLRGNRAMKRKAWDDSEAIVTGRDGKNAALFWNGVTFNMTAPVTVIKGALVKFRYNGTFTTGRPRDASFIAVRDGATMRPAPRLSVVDNPAPSAMARDDALRPL